MSRVVYAQTRLEGATLTEALKKAHLSVKISDEVARAADLVTSNVAFVWVGADDPLDGVLDRVDACRKAFKKVIVIGAQTDQGAPKLASLQLEVTIRRGLVFIPVADENGVASLLCQQLKVDDSSSTAMTLVRTSCDASTKAVVSALPGISDSVAHKLLCHFKTLARIAEATESELLAVEGLGPAAASRIFRFLRCASGHDKYGGRGST
mmetsp:Transcript_39892/g.86369  ORF Transcript_39892/g.86369 Transcript_39892/m.86369 type:complete len:209 (-) Transcript_39892:126-752(-)